MTQREKWAASSALWRIRHPEKVKEIRKNNARYNREYGWQHRDQLRLETLTHYGPSGQLCCSWVDCHISDSDMLVLDHIADNGAKEKRELGGSAGRGWNFYRRLKSLGFPSGYQTLCCNHNHKKELLRARKQRTS